MVGIDGYIPVKYGSTYRPCPGYKVEVLDSNHKEVPPGTLGMLTLLLMPLAGLDFCVRSDF
jgi:acyl-coenzyme A synthetase/AMP-(fatty) acid ligase